MTSIVVVDFHEFERLDLLMVIITSRPPKLKIWIDIRLRNHVKSISSKYELNPTEIKNILQGCRSKKVKNHDFFGFHEFGPLDLSMVKINSRTQKLKIWVEILLGNNVKSISSKYEHNPTEIKYILQGCRSKKVKNHDIFDIHEFGRLDLFIVKNQIWTAKIKNLSRDSSSKPCQKYFLKIWAQSDWN